MKYKILILFCLTKVVLGQKFMIHDFDTIPYKEKIIIQTDTIAFGNTIYYPGDTTYESPCHTFEKIDGRIVNYSDDQCLRQGQWIIYDSIGNYWIGNYLNHHKVGIWKQFDANGKLIKEVEDISIGKDSYRVKEINYTINGPVYILDKVFLSFYIKHFALIMSLLIIAFFTRPFINSKIYNRENGTNISPIYFGLPFTKNYWEFASHRLKCLFTFWFLKYKPENRRLAIISNTLSLIVILIFLISLVGLKLSGDI